MVIKCIEGPNFYSSLLLSPFPAQDSFSFPCFCFIFLIDFIIDNHPSPLSSTSLFSPGSHHLPLLFLLLNDNITATIKSSCSGFYHWCAVAVAVVTVAASVVAVFFSTTSMMKQPLQITDSASLPHPDTAACSPPLQSSCRSPWAPPSSPSIA